MSYILISLKIKSVLAAQKCIESFNDCIIILLISFILSMKYFRLNDLSLSLRLYVISFKIHINDYEKSIEFLGEHSGLVIEENSNHNHPSKCNRSESHHPTHDEINQHKWFVLLDAASYVATNTLDLSVYPADFVAVSFYKMFGFPTGIAVFFACNYASL